MPQIVSKDITTVEQGLILHVVNNRGAMGAGLAKVLYTKWPEVKEVYLSDYNFECRCGKMSLDLGMVQQVIVSKGLQVWNLVAQDGFGRDGRRYVDYDALRTCLSRVADYVYITEQDVYIPYNMGCGLAGGDWSIVAQIIDQELPDAIICKL